MRTFQKGEARKLHLFALLTYVLLFLQPVTASSDSDKTANVQKPVLSPDKFPYPMKMGYESAQKHPEVIRKLFCYCGCDKAENHESLMDCYVSTHGAYCEICLEEAIKADELCSKKRTIREIQKEVDAAFAKLYPLTKPTAALLKYREELKKEGLALGPLPKQGAKSSSSTSSQGKCCGDHGKTKK
ncbi:MAG: PCYCGC domain-containing protein [Candidatus Obscuribacterales bacterium]|jgi:hypothetical protein|nr:PCYCGC domain-containing protein [Candidatus Obscuribacterales bacterium]